MKEKKPPASFTREIRCIMHSFGDSKKPLWDTVLYVEKILRQQMNLLLTKSTEVTHLRKGESISHEDLLFLLRKNKVKIRRLLQYLYVKDSKEVLNKPNRLLDLAQNPECGKRVKKCIKFLNMIDNLLMYDDIMKDDIPDPVLRSRNERRYLMISSMTDEEYFEFKDTQQTTFFPKGGAEEFTSWLLEDGVTDLIPTPFALEIINYLARETICEIIDLVMRLRKDKNPNIPTLVPKAEPNESEDKMDIEGCSLKENNDAITVSEIKEAIRRYLKICNKNELFSKENVDLLIPDGLLCC